jgi:hypothetical protein
MQPRLALFMNDGPARGAWAQECADIIEDDAK